MVPWLSWSTSSLICSTRRSVPSTSDRTAVWSRTDSFSGPVIENAPVIGVGESSTAAAQATMSPGCTSGSAVSGSTVYVPCLDGTRAVDIDTAGHATVRWQTPVRAADSPVVGGGVVWTVDISTGALFALDPATGAVRNQISLGPVPHFTSPTLAGDTVYVGTTSGVVAIAGA